MLKRVRYKAFWTHTGEVELVHRVPADALPIGKIRYKGNATIALIVPKTGRLFVDQAASVMGVEVQTIYKWIHAKQLRSEKGRDGRRVVIVDELRKYAIEHQLFMAYRPKGKAWGDA